MTSDASTPLQVISIFSINEASGHSVDDDLFYYGILDDSGVPFKFYAPRYSLERLQQERGVGANQVVAIGVEDRGLITTIKAINSIPVLPRANVILLGYSEKFVFLFYLLKLLKNYRLVLVATNNFSVWRAAKYRLHMQCLFALLRGRLRKIVVHTEKEKSIIANLRPALARKTRVKKHHLMIPRRVAKPANPLQRKVISFFGPAKHDKPVKPIIDLMTQDTERVFSYQLFNVDGARIVAEHGLASNDNIKIVDKWLSREEYFDEFSKSSLIMMSHDQSFEGKLSGNLCDCISLGVPFIAMDIDPVSTYARQYGPIGYTYRFSDSNWPAAFLADIASGSYEGICANLRNAGRDHTRPIVEADNLKALLD